MALTRRTRTATYLDPLGAPCVGTVTFRINSATPVVDLAAPAVVLTQSIEVPLDVTGSISASLICSDDPNVYPQDWVWIVDEDVRTGLGVGAGRPRYAILVSLGDLATSDIDDTPHYIPETVGAEPYVVTVCGKTGPAVNLLAADIPDLGTSATRDVGTTAADVAAGDAPGLAQAAAQAYSDLFNARAEGLLADPTITYLGGTQVQIGASAVLTRAATDWSGALIQLPVPQSTLTLVNGAVNHIYAAYSGGSVTWASSTNRSVLNVSTNHPAYRVAMDTALGGVVYAVTFGAIGVSTAARTMLRMVRLETPVGGSRISGLAVSELATRKIVVSSGSAYCVLREIPVSQKIQGDPGVITYLWHHTAGSWVRATRAQYSNSEYDNGTSLQTLSPNRYAVNWVLLMPTVGEIAFVLGGGNYTLSQAQSSSIPVLPNSLTEFFIPLGRIIVEYGAATATQVDQISPEGGGLLSVAIPWVTPPAAPTSAGSPGALAFDNGHLYVCYQSGIWMRFTADVTPWV
jgi:hypothetical protein